MERTYKLLTLIFILLQFYSPVWSQLVTIVNYDFNAGTSYGTLTPSLASNVTSTASSTESFVTYAGTASGASAFTTNATAGNALGMSNSSGTNTRYFQFQLGGSSLSDYKSYQLYLQAQRSATGAQTVTLAYSTDGVSYTNFVTTMSPGNGSFVEQVFDLTSITSLDNQSDIYFRLMASVASGTGTLRIDNFQVGAINLPAGTPSITVGSITSFGNVVVNTTSTEKSYTIQASNLAPAAGNITITPPSGFEISLTSGSNYSNSAIQIPYINNSLAETNVFLVFKPTLAQAYSGNITNAGGGATTKNVAVSGTGINPTVIYRSAGTGDWNVAGSWESSVNDGTTWSAASAVPSSSDESITVRSGHTITLSSPVTADQLTIDANGQITIASGQTLTIANGTGTDLIINGTLLNSGTLTINSSVAWEVNAGGSYVHNTSSSASTLLNTNPTLVATSNWIYRGASGSSPSISVANRTYGNLKFESTSGSMSISSTSGSNPLTINGNFSVGAAGGGTVSYSTSGFTGGINISGNLEIGTNSTLTVGTSTISIGGNWTNNGTFNSGTSTVSFNGNPVAIINSDTRMVIDGSSTVSFNGNSEQQISGTNSSNFYKLTLNNVQGLQLNKDVVINDVLTLTNGPISIGSNTLTLNGTISKTNGGLTGGNNSNLIVSGSADQLNLPAVSLNNLQLNRVNGLMLGGNLTVSGLLTLTNGALSIGANTLTLNGTISVTNGSLSGGATSNIVIGQAGAPINVPAVEVNNFTLNRLYGANLTGNLIVSGTLLFTEGLLNTQNYIVTLGAAASISGETSNKNVNGTITTTRNVGTGSSTFGGIGVELNAGVDDLGNVSITRNSGSAVIINSSQSINKKWVITSASPPANGRNLSLIWFASDDNGKNLSNMQMWKSGDGNNWASVGSFQDVSATRKITAGVASFSIFTASDNSNPLAPPSAPTNLTAAPSSVSEINLNWTDNSTIETGFKIERKLGTGGAYSEIAVVGANTTNYADGGLNDNTQYFYRIRSYNSAGNSDYSNEANATTFLAIPQTPSNLTATSLSTSSINLSWNDNSTNEDGFRIERKLGAGGSYTEIAVVGGNVTNYLNTGLDDLTEYYYRIRAYNASGASDYSNEAQATTQLAIPQPPTNFVAAALGTNAMNLTWQDNSGKETGFSIERKSEFEIDFIEIFTTSANVTNYVDSGLEDSTGYTYRVRSFNATGYSAYSNESIATTFLAVPQAPTNLTLNDISINQIRLNWTDNSMKESGFKIERKQANPGNYNEIAIVGKNETTFLDIGLDDDTEYFYRVRAYNSAGVSDYSNEVLGKTLLAPPPAPDNLIANNVSTSEISLRWGDNSAREQGFKIERKLGPNGVYSEVAVVGENITNYTDTELNDNTLYYYRVKAYNLAGESAYSNEANATTLLAVPLRPDELITTTLSVSEISLGWRDNSWNEAGFKIERKSGSQGSYSEIASVNSNVTNYIDSGLEDYTEYFYRIKSFNTAAESGYSNESRSKTFIIIPETPSNLIADSIGVNAIVLRWANPKSPRRPSDNSPSTIGYRIERRFGISGNFYEIGVLWENRTYYLDSELSENTEYHYRVRAFNSKTIGDYSNILVVKTLMSVPQSPDLLLAQALSTSEIFLSWRDNSYNETGFRIERKQGGIGTYILIAIVKQNDTTFHDKRLEDDTEYLYRVISFNPGGESNYSNILSAKTHLALPNPPIFLEATAKSESEIELSWFDNSAKEAGFKIERRMGSGGSYSVIDSVSQNVTSYLDKELEDSTEYYYRINAFNLAGSSEYSNESSAKTYLAISAPPSKLIAQSLSANTIELNWHDNSVKEDGFTVERSQGTTDKFEEIITLGENECFYLDEGLLDNTEYFYRVRSFNTAGVSVYSNESSARTKLVLPSTPIDLIAVLLSFSIIKLEWQDSSRSTEGYRIEVSINSADDFREISTIYKPNTSYSDTIFSSTGVYFFRIRAFNSLGNSDYSSIVGVVISKQKIDLIPTEFKLFQNYPNPFNSYTVIKYMLPKESYVELKLYSMIGQEIMTLVQGVSSAGYYEIKFDASGLNTGIYVYKIKAGNFSSVKKMLLIK